jgi:CubicO group peptidase (beta-lactamase class C family)
VTVTGAHPELQRPRNELVVRHLLSHTSGIPFSSSIETPTLDVYPLATRVQSYALEPLMFQPASDFSYSNTGVNTAARVLEIVSGKSYESFLRDRLFVPLGMSETTFWPNDSQVARLAKSYKANALGTNLEDTSITQLQYPLTDRIHRFPMPEGGSFSTASDLAKFCQMFLNGGTYAGKRLLSYPGGHPNSPTCGQVKLLHLTCS